MRVHAELIDDETLTVVVSDDGVGMAAHAESSGFGIGVPLMGDVADSVEVAAGGGTRVSARLSSSGRPGRTGAASRASRSAGALGDGSLACYASAATCRGARRRAAAGRATARSDAPGCRGP